jgi:hypothetical protein
MQSALRLSPAACAHQAATHPDDLDGEHLTLRPALSEATDRYASRRHEVSTHIPRKTKKGGRLPPLGMTRTGPTTSGGNTQGRQECLEFLPAIVTPIQVVLHERHRFSSAMASHCRLSKPVQPLKALVTRDLI